VDFDKELEQQIGKLKRSIRKMVLGSKEFTTLRQLLKQGEFELQIYLIPLGRDRRATVDPTQIKGIEEIQFELTKEDKVFLKDAGIRIDE